MGKDEEELRTLEERSKYARNFFIPIPNPNLSGVVDFREHQEDIERREQGPKEVKLSNLVALLAPILVLIIILIILIYF
jgi:hypothetical protein